MNVCFRLVAKHADELYAKHGALSDHIMAKRSNISSAWEDLKNKSAERKKLLDESYRMHKFLAEHKDLLSWIEMMKNVISSSELAKDVAGAELLLERHQEHKGEIDARDDSFQSTESEGKLLIEQLSNKSEVSPMNVFIFDLF